MANYGGGLVVILAERYFRYKNIADIQKFENSFFNDPEEIRYNLNSSLDSVFDRLFSSLKSHSDKVTMEDRGKYEKIFLAKGRITTAERIFKVLKLAREENKIKFEFDWTEWTKVYPDPPLKYLYLFVSTFYQFGNSISLDFLLSFSEFKNFSKIEISNAIDGSTNQPIIRNSEMLYLRHEKIAEWYIKLQNESENVKEIIERWLGDITSEFSKNLLLWTYRNADFKRSEFSQLLPLRKVENILVEYLKKNSSDLSSRTELSKIYQQQKKWKEAEDILLDLLSIDKENLQARTELSKVYQNQNKWEEAEGILLELLGLDKENLQARTELSKIYQHQKKWEEAEDKLKEYLVLDPWGLHPRTELSKIYQQQNKWKEAEDILLDLLSIDKENLQARTELSRIYQRQKKWKEAKDILLESLEIDNQQLHPRTELSRIYQQQRKWKDAEEILLESIQINCQQLHPRTELSKIYQEQRKWKEAEDILLELLGLDSANLQARTELSKIYQQQKKWEEAENILLELLSIDEANLQARTELSKIYQQEKKWEEAKGILLESLQIDSQQLHPRTELSKIYQHQKKWKEAEDILLELLDLDRANLQARTELSKIYQHQKKWKKAEDILLEEIRIAPDALHPRTELSKIYQQEKKWKEAEDILLESIQINSQQLHPRTELSKVYQHQEKWKEAEEILLELLAIDSENYRALTELSRLYNSWRRIESSDHSIKKKFVDALINSYSINNRNIQLLNIMAKYLIERLEYRAALNIIEIIRKQPNDDLQGIILSLQLFSKMGREDKVKDLVSVAEQILINEPYNRFKGKYHSCMSGLSTKNVPVDCDLIGVIEILNPNLIFIKGQDGKRIKVKEKKRMSKNVKNQDSVFYSTFSNKMIEADFIEPFFQNETEIISMLKC